MTSSDLIKLRADVKKSYDDLVVEIDRLMLKDGGVVMFETMNTPEKIRFVVDAVADYAGLSNNDLRGYKKKLHLTKWIKIICYILQDKLFISVADIRIFLRYKSNQCVQFHTDTLRGFIESKDKDNDIVVALNEILTRLQL